MSDKPKHRRLTGGEIVCESLLREGVDVVFGIPGGASLPLYDTMSQYPQIRHILTRHEQGAAHAADGYARVSGRAGVCFATSGPGATNLVTGLANAHLDSVPVVAITANVARPMLGRDAFQEIDITGITLPVTKHNYLVMNVDEIAEAIAEAFHIATTGRPGPVLVDIPKDVLTARADFHYPTEVRLRGYRPNYQGHPGQIKKAAKLLNEAERPLIIAGHGIRISRSFEELAELAEKAEIPVITTLLGQSSFSESHRLSMGMPGMHGHAYTNYALYKTDIILALGMRFDDRACGKFSEFAPQAKIVHVDIDPGEIGKNVRVDVPIVGDVKNVLVSLLPLIQPKTRPSWLSQIDELKRQHPTYVPDGDVLLPQHVISGLSEATDGDAYIVSDVGQHQMWVAQLYRFTRPNSHFTSGGLGTMGFSLPAAMGVKVAKPESPVWVVCGDGSIQMTIQEMATLKQDNIAVKIALINNGHLGMVRQWQHLFYQKRIYATPLANPDFVKLAEAYGLKGIRVEHRRDVVSAMREASEHDGPALIEFMVAPEENCYPMVAPGAANSEMFLLPAREEVTVS